MCDTGEPVYLSLHDWGGWQSSVSACVREINLWTGHGHPLRFSGPLQVTGHRCPYLCLPDGEEQSASLPGRA